MGKIKGWKKEREGTYIYEYSTPRGSQTGNIIFIRKAVRGGRYVIGWDITYYGYGRRAHILNQKPFKTKSQALNYARAWMKAHPRG